MSCGPTNALQKLSNHAQLDRSLQADQQLRMGSQRPGGFRTTGTSHQLEAEFQQHLQQNQAPHAFNSTFQQNIHPQELLAHQHQQQQQHIRQQQHPGGWANDFASLSISNGGISKQQPMQRSNDWSSQFMTHNAQKQQQQHQQQMKQQAFMQPQIGLNQANHLLNSQFQHQQFNQSLQQHHRTEHQEMHDLNKFGDQLENEFSRLEQEFVQEPIKQEEPIVMKNQNEQFKSVAKEVANVMNTSKDSKFANSKFLQLMNMVSAGQVELNDEETKLVDNQGNDIHKQQLHQSEQPNFDFLETHNAHGGDIERDDYSGSFERTQRDPEMEELQDTNHRHRKLPDPLAGITAEDLSSPYESARAVGEVHHEKYTWDELYDDYKHDDSSF